MIEKGSGLRWWLIFCIQIIIVLVPLMFGFYTDLWTMDRTKLSFVIIGVWFMSSVSIGCWHTMKNPTHLIKIGWFMSEVCVAFGLVGTVSGFLIMLGETFETLDVESTASLQQAISSMAIGMSTALYTTLAGIIAGLAIKMQVVNIEHGIDKNEQRELQE